jgi:hypothetical protein
MVKLFGKPSLKLHTSLVLQTNIYDVETLLLARSFNCLPLIYKSQWLFHYPSYLKNALSHTLDVHKVVYVKLWQGEL